MILYEELIFIFSLERFLIRIVELVFLNVLLGFCFSIEDL